MEDRQVCLWFIALALAWAVLSGFNHIDAKRWEAQETKLMNTNTSKRTH